MALWRRGQWKKLHPRLQPVQQSNARGRGGDGRVE